MAAVGARPSSSPCSARSAFDADRQTVAIDNAPNNHGEHLGSAYQGAWYGYVRKDLRTRARAQGQGPLLARYCGARLAEGCRAALRSRCGGALTVPATKLYGGDPSARPRRGDQWCFDAVRSAPTAAPPSR